LGDARAHPAQHVELVPVFKEGDRLCRILPALLARPPAPSPDGRRRALILRAHEAVSHIIYASGLPWPSRPSLVMRLDSSGWDLQGTSEPPSGVCCLYHSTWNTTPGLSPGEAGPLPGDPLPTAQIVATHCCPPEGVCLPGSFAPRQSSAG